MIIKNMTIIFPLNGDVAHMFVNRIVLFHEAYLTIEVSPCLRAPKIHGLSGTCIAKLHAFPLLRHVCLGSI